MRAALIVTRSGGRDGADLIVAFRRDVRCNRANISSAAQVALCDEDARDRQARQPFRHFATRRIRRLSSLSPRFYDLATAFPGALYVLAGGKAHSGGAEGSL